MSNATFFESSNGWQFQVTEGGQLAYRFRGEGKWEHIGTQMGLGFIEWAQSEIWTDSEEEQYQAGCGSWDCRSPECGRV